MRISDWSSDVCSSDLRVLRHFEARGGDATGIAGLARRVQHAGFEEDIDCFQRARHVRAFGHALDLVGNELACVVVVERSEEHTSELQSLMRISYAVFCLKKKNYPTKHINLKSLDD